MPASINLTNKHNRKISPSRITVPGCITQRNNSTAAHTVHLNHIFTIHIVVIGTECQYSTFSVIKVIS
jgi:hypothetical protein